MKKVMAIVVLATMLIAVAPLSAHAGGAVSAALALGAFATFAVLTAPFWAVNALAAYPAVYPAVPHATPVYYAPQPYAAAAPAPPAAPAIQREVIYPHGRHVLYGDGVSVAYRWVWVPAPPPPPAAIAPPPPPVGAPPPPPPR